MSVYSEAAAFGSSYLRRRLWPRPMPTRLDTLRPTLGSPGWVHARGILVVLPGLLARGVVARLGLDTGCGFRPMPAVVHEWS
jgi:hypothetical protein